MRTTIDIDDTIMHELKEAARIQKTSLKAIINQALQRSISDPGKGSTTPYQCPVFNLGGLRTVSLNLDKALAIASGMEDEEIARKLELRK